MMKKIFVFLTFVVISIGCSSAAPEVQDQPTTNTAQQSDEVRKTVASHDAPRTPLPDNTASAPAGAPERSTTRKKFSRSGDPIDTSKFDEAIAAAKKASDAKPDDDGLKKALGTKYFERGVALTGARQYASAIGDFRKAIKLDPSNKDAEQQIKVITSIYESMNIEGPKPGEEPEPLRK